MLRVIGKLQAGMGSQSGGTIQLQDCDSCEPEMQDCTDVGERKIQDMTDGGRGGTAVREQGDGPVFLLFDQMAVTRAFTDITEAGQPTSIPFSTLSTYSVTLFVRK